MNADIFVNDKFHAREPDAVVRHHGGTEGESGSPRFTMIWSAGAEAWPRSIVVA